MEGTFVLDWRARWLLQLRRWELEKKLMIEVQKNSV